MENSLKHKIVEKIIQSNDETLLQEIQALVGLSESDFWNHLSTHVQEDLELSKAEFDAGAGIPHDKVMQDVRNQFGFTVIPETNASHYPCRSY